MPKAACEAEIGQVKKAVWQDERAAAVAAKSAAAEAEKAAAAERQAFEATPRVSKAAPGKPGDKCRRQPTAATMPEMGLSHLPLGCCRPLIWHGLK